MNPHALILALACALVPTASAPASAKAAAGKQDEKKWKPYQFKGNEKFEYKVVMTYFPQVDSRYHATPMSSRKCEARGRSA